MATALQAHRETLLSTIRGVRSRWRWKVVLRSLTVLLGAGLGTILVAAYGLEQFRFSPAAIITAKARYVLEDGSGQRTSARVPSIDLPGEIIGTRMRAERFVRPQVMYVGAS